MQRTEIEQAFNEAGLKARVATINQLVRNSVRLFTTPVNESTLAPGVSKIGGHPDLPPGIHWPELKGKPQSFLAQIRLTDLQELESYGLPPHQGTLWFFYDASQQTFGEQPGDRAGWHIFFNGDPSVNLQRVPTPADLPAASLFQACSLTPKSELTLALQPELELPDSHWTEPEQQIYEQILEKLHTPEDLALPHHRFLGYPDTIQDDMRIQCQLVSNGVTSDDDPRVSKLQTGASDWLLLLQVDSDTSAKMRWASDGMIYYWIKRTDLQAHRFDESWLVLQSE